ncbi:outer membrane protein assembly factor BamA [Fluviicola sp.]|uniref:outer membrane protein assembly factor BamA n=1 Tax=Fluviicola sp. TaxID=1917219 RepID=UPI002627846A|nr:outer membrane protein assembly factor BamA [Fluviicola sp.]
MKKILSILFITCVFQSFGQTGDSTAVKTPADKIDSTRSSTTIGGGMNFDYANAEKYILGPIRIEGADNFDPQAIKLIAGLKQGDQITIPSDKISNAIKNLWNEGLFSSISIEAEKEIAGVIYLVIKLAPRPKLSRFRFTGVTKREVDKIREEVDLSSGQTITENLLFNTKNKIRGHFLEKGYNNIAVNITQVQDTLINNSEIFFIDIDKGKKVKIKEIIFDGNTTIKPWKLRKVMKDTKRRSIMRIFKRSKFNQTAYNRDKEAVLDKFRGAGLRDVRFAVDSVYKINSRNLGIYFKIEEGQKYYFGDITWIGNTKFSSGLLDTVLGIKYGDIYDKPLLDQRLKQSQDGRDITSLYMDRGYLFYHLEPVETGVKDNHINYEMRMVEGKEARVKNIIIKGNYKTNEHVIRREIRTKPGDLFNRNDIIRTQRELAQLGYFNEQGFQVNPIPNPTDGTVDIEYVVEEKSADQIELSGGYGAGRIIGTLGLTFSNFSVKNIFKPNSWSPLPTGDGQRLSIRAQTNGRIYQGYNFSFTEPWLGGKKPNSFTFYVNHTSFSSSLTLKKRAPNYSGVAITGAGIGLGRRKKFPDDYFSAYYELAYQYYDVQNYANLFPSFQDGYANDISLKYALQRNSINSPIYPTEGSKISFTAKGTLPYSLFTKGKDYSAMSAQETFKYLEYYKLKFTFEYYLPLTPDKKLVLMPRIGFGYMGAYNRAKGLTPFERFNLGGSGLSGVNQFGGREIIALRGYDDNALSSSGGDPIVAKYTMELRYPISLNPQATFFVLAFAEAGNTYTGFKTFNPFNVKRSVGAGVRIFLPMFGMLGLDYGWGFDKLDKHSYGYGGSIDQSIDSKGYFPKFTFTIGMNLGEL